MRHKWVAYPCTANTVSSLLPAGAPGSMDFELQHTTTRRQEKQLMEQKLQDMYGPFYADTDVRLYLKKREQNAAKSRGVSRGGFPMDDSFDKPQTFLKFSDKFQQRICRWQRRSACQCMAGGRQWAVIACSSTHARCFV